MQDQPSSDAIVLRRALACPPETAWTALTDQAKVANWWGDYVRLEAAPQGSFREEWRDGDGRTVVTSGKITRFEPPATLELTWKDDDWPVQTIVRFTIAPAAGGTMLAVIHTGWDRFPEQQGPALRKAHEAGWKLHLDGLATLLSGTAS